MPTGARTFIAKGVYRFKSIADADRQDKERIARAVACTALERT